MSSHPNKAEKKSIDIEQCIFMIKRLYCSRVNMVQGQVTWSRSFVAFLILEYYIGAVLVAYNMTNTKYIYFKNSLTYMLLLRIRYIFFLGPAF
jgi:hypothetical protein